LYSEQQLKQPDFPYQGFDEDAVTTWVWGHSFRHSKPVLVPQTYAYYQHKDPDEPQWAYECSNGCALGGSVEEAVLHGLLEVVERDAFLMSWYGRMPLPQLDLSSVPDPEVRLLAEHVESERGYRLHAFNMTGQERIPCFWAMAVDIAGGPDRPKA